MEKMTPSDVAESMVGKELLLYGVVLHIRDFGSKKFIILTDGYNNLQVVYEGNEKIRRGDAIKVKGVLHEDQRAPRGIELRVKDLKVLSQTIEEIFDQWTLRKMSKDKKIKYRQLVLRLPEYFKIFDTYAKAAQKFREYFIKNKYLEVFTPKIVVMGTESGSEVFSILYFDKEAYLAQSPQLYKQMILASGVKGVFEIASYYRSEVSFTPRHITEFRSVDAEVNYIEDYNEVMDVLEESVKYVCEYFNIKIKDIPRITFEDAQSIIKEKDPKAYRWDDISTEGERIIGEYIKEEYDSELVFITDYPTYSRAFYYMRYDDNPKKTKSFDLLFRGLEIASGGQREHRYNVLIQQLKEKGINPDRLKYYLEAFKYGIPPHGGFGLGLDRFVKQLLNLDDIRECVLWPRDPDTLIP